MLTLQNFWQRIGFLVVGHDHLGHGETAKEESELGFFAEKHGWERLTEDIHILQNQIQKEYPELPYFMMGHSMGSLLVRTYLTKYKDTITGAIISGTSGQKYGLTVGKLLIRGMVPLKGKKYRSKFIKSLVTGSFNQQFKPNKTESDWITGDERQINQFIKDPKCGAFFTIQAYYDLFTGTKYLSKQRNINQTPHIPILIFSGDKDPVGGNGKGVIRVYEMLEKTGNEKVTIRLFKDGRHEMLNEINREEVYYFILQWLEEVIGG